MSLRCLVVDDNLVFLAAASATLERQGLAVVGMATSVDEGLERGEQLEPDVFLVDIDLGEESGFELARQVDGSKVILISAHPEDDFADLIAESPAVGFLAKSDLSGEAIQALLRA
jgi:CheY-like chemotaxis protein